MDNLQRNKIQKCNAPSSISLSAPVFIIMLNIGYYFVCVDIVRYTVEQHVFLYKSYVEGGSARKCQ
jgi:hypothetical protein